MAYRHFNIRLLARIVFLIATAAGIGFCIAKRMPFAGIVLVLAGSISVWELFRFLNRTNKQISFFIKAIKNEDTSLRFPPKTGNSTINELHRSLNELNVILQEVKVESRIKEKYFGEIVQHMATGVVVLNNNGFVSNVNSAALELLGLETFTHLSQLDRIDLRFKKLLSGLEGKQKKIVNLQKRNEIVQIMLRCSVIRSEKEDIKLITLQDIRGELERKEIDAWVKLIRVLSHEIMNSLAPVTSIAQSLQRIWKQNRESEQVYPADKEVAKTIGGLEVISEMSEALIRFVQSYRVLSKAPQPQLNTIQVHSFFDRLNILLSPMKEEFKGSIAVLPPPNNFQLVADEQMMVQVILNLVKNAVEAFAGHEELTTQAKISITAIRKKEIVEIQVKDNGKGIPKEFTDEIFVPFFTTKKNGSGIGLSYSKQIVRAHGGSLFFQSKPGETTFTIRW